MSTDGFIEAGKNLPTEKTEKVTTAEVLAIPSLDSNENYKNITGSLRTWHGELLRMESEGKLSNATENPGLIGDYLGRLRLNCNMLFSFLNNYIDVENDLIKELNEKRQAIYEARLREPKGTPSAADTHSKAMTRVDEASLKVVQNRITQIKNEYERYNGICMYLQSRLKEFNTERIMG